jgi:hypothetical protein
MGLPERHRLKDLIDRPRRDTISPPARKQPALKQELNRHHGTKQFSCRRGMGDVARLNPEK